MIDLTPDGPRCREHPELELVDAHAARAHLLAEHPALAAALARIEVVPTNEAQRPNRAARRAQARHN